MCPVRDVQRRKRFTRQMKQELISRCQFCEEIIRQGWMPGEESLDLGEDLIAHIYLDGVASGVSVFFQLKSTRDWVKDILKNGDTLTRRFDVQHLKDWGEFAQPCILVVWNVNLRKGRWVLVDEAIVDLDQRRPGWRSQSTTTVRFPVDNTVDHSGLVRLRHRIGHRMYDVIARGRDPEFKVKAQVGGSDQGPSRRTALEDFFRKGERVELVGPEIASFEGPEWWMRWFGDTFDPEKQMLVMESQGAKKALPASIAMNGNNGIVEILRHIELRIVRAGTESLLLSNAHQSYPIHIWIPIERHQPALREKARIEQVRGGSDVCETHGLLRFFSALFSGGVLEINLASEELGRESLRLQIDPLDGLVSDQELQLFDQLCTIQVKSGKILTMPERGLTQSDIEFIPHLLRALRTGEVEVSGGTATIDVSKEGLLILADRINEINKLYFRASEPKSELEFLGQKLDFGPVIIRMHGVVDAEAQELRDTAEALDEGQTVPIRVVDADITWEYQNYL